MATPYYQGDLMTEPHYPTCDHPRLLVADGVCNLCDQFDGQTDALDEINK